jgi:hypothetical protein
LENLEITSSLRHHLVTNRGLEALAGPRTRLPSDSVVYPTMMDLVLRIKQMIHIALLGIAACRSLAESA